MSIPILTKGYLSGALVNNNRIVKFDSSDKVVIQAAAETDGQIGVAEMEIASGVVGDVVMQGICEVEAGGNITRGNLVTADANGKAVAVTDTMVNSVTIYYIGIALVSAVSGDIFEILVCPGKLSKLDGITASADEVNLADGSVAGTAVASKLACLGANKNLDEFHTAALYLGADAGTLIAATAAEINRACDVSARIVDCTASTLTVTEATHDGKIITLNRAAGIAVTLPAATGSGTKLTFITTTTVTSNTSTIKVVGNDTMVGVCTIFQDGGNTALMIEAGGTDDTMTFDGSTTGGIKGDIVELIDIAADLWYVRAVISATGSEATPFSATVTP